MNDQMALLEAAWGLIANASEGNWEKEAPERKVVNQLCNDCNGLTSGVCSRHSIPAPATVQPNLTVLTHVQFVNAPPSEPIIPALPGVTAAAGSPHRTTWKVVGD